MGEILSGRLGLTDRAGRTSTFHSRERRLSRSALSDLYRTHAYTIPTATVNDGYAAGDLLLPATYATTIEVTVATPVGLIFEVGNATTAVAAWIDDTDISLRAGTGGGEQRAVATYTVAGGLPVGLRLGLVFAIDPGSGQLRIWDHRGKELARATSVAGDFLPEGWAADSDGAFAAAATGALPADVTQTGAPSNFACVAPLSFYAKQKPRHFV